MKTAAEIGQATLDLLTAQAAANRAAGAAIRAEAAMQAYKGPRRLTAKRVLAMLTCSPLPSVRTVQEHMQAIRAESSTPG